ncbi:MAG: hypothetical protein ACJ8BF_11795 [Gemmatimonadales bacterium]
MILARAVLAVGLLGAFQGSLWAQDWAGRFPPAPECEPQLRLSPVPDSTLHRAGRARLIVLLRILGAPANLSYVRAALTPVTSPLGKMPGAGTLDTAPVRVVETDTTGAHVLHVQGMGYGRFLDTLTPRTGYSDTIVVWLRHFDDEYRNNYNCRPRGFRQAGELACVTDSLESSFVLDRALRYAQPEEQKTFRLPRFDSTQVTLVRDEKTCLRAAKLYGHPGDPPRKVVVVRMGPLYLVYDPYEPLPAGEWDIYRLFDRRWRPVFDLMG